VVFALRNVVNRRRGELQGAAKTLGSKLFQQSPARFGSTRSRTPKKTSAVPR
jgi:hypothetical protein